MAITPRPRGQLTAADQYETAGNASAQLTITLEVTETQAKAILEQSGGGQLPMSLLVCPAPTPTSPATSPTAATNSLCASWFKTR